MSAVAAASLNIHGDDDIGPEHAPQPDIIADNVLPSPLLDCFLRAERVMKLECAREILLGAVDAVRREQFGGAQHGEVVEQLRADFVLPAVAAIVLQIDHAQPHAVSEIREQRVGLVVGVRGGLQERAGDAQLTKRETELDMAVVRRHPRIVLAVLSQYPDIVRGRPRAG